MGNASTAVTANEGSNALITILPRVATPTSPPPIKTKQTTGLGTTFFLILLSALLPTSQLPQRCTEFVKTDSTAPRHRFKAEQSTDVVSFKCFFQLLVTLWSRVLKRPHAPPMFPPCCVVPLACWRVSTSSCSPYKLLIFVPVLCVTLQMLAVSERLVCMRLHCCLFYRPTELTTTPGRQDVDTV